MAKWSSSVFGTFFTRSEPWELWLNGSEIELKRDGSSLTFQAHDGVIKTTTGAFWTSVEIYPLKAPTISLDGIPNDSANDMVKAIERSVDILKVKKLQQEKEALKRKKLSEFDTLLASIVTWGNAVDTSVKWHKDQRRWINEEALQRWITSLPKQDGDKVQAQLRDAEISLHLTTKDIATQNAVSLLKIDLREKARSLNEAFLHAEKVACKGFLDKVEKSPLTDDQIRSVVCFDNRVLTIASAGSGKTSTMVAKAGYALHRKFFTADKILLLAFNDKAAKELQARVIERLAPLGFKADDVVARTFHAFGLGIIGKATGRKPSLAPWLDKGKDIQHLSDLIDTLKDTNPLFRTRWDLFRMVLSRDLPSIDKEEAEPEYRDFKTKRKGFRTLKDDVVKSHGERMIADWLFYNGVNYTYEQDYEHDTVTADHKQYTPDFFYPDISLYHEHWALDNKGNPPPAFKGYKDGIKWKRALHKHHQTSLIETTSAQLRNGKAFSTLEVELTKRGITLDPNPERPAVGRKPIEHEKLVKVFRTFLTHAKSNKLSNAMLRERLKQQASGSFSYRHELFLDMFVDIRQAWEDSLKAKNWIDFEDMLNQATDHITAGKWKSDFELVMVDEFQDASWARARLIRALVKEPGRFLFAVGDDWQSINRYAGSDISVMTLFEQWFGKAETIKLEQTFRCPQSLCDISSKFVLKNPSQITKRVYSDKPEFPRPLQIFQTENEDKIHDSVNQFLAELCVGLEIGKIPPATKGKIQVFVLSRYNLDEKFIPLDWKKNYGKHIEVTFSSIHSSKGLEADYVIMPRMVSGSYSFPSTIESDPVLQLAMPCDENYPFAEERRLFYVALTRARRSVTIITIDGLYSSFVVELVHDLKLEVKTIDGKKADVLTCPRCKQGTLIKKPGKYGDFLSCVRYPACEHSENLKSKMKPTKLDSAGIPVDAV